MKEKMREMDALAGLDGKIGDRQAKFAAMSMEAKILQARIRILEGQFEDIINSFEELIDA